MKNTMKRVLAALLSVVLVVGLMGMQAVGADEPNLDERKCFGTIQNKELDDGVIAVFNRPASEATPVRLKTYNNPISEDINLDSITNISNDVIVIVGGNVLMNGTISVSGNRQVTIYGYDTPVISSKFKTDGSTTVPEATITKKQGGTIDGNVGRLCRAEGFNGNLLRISDSARVTIKNVVLNGNSVGADSASHAAIWMRGGKLDLYDAALILNWVRHDPSDVGKTASDRFQGSAIKQTGGEINMYSGYIACNWAQNYGNIYIGKDATFNMYGGTVTHNMLSREMDTCGGGFYVDNGGKLNVIAGTISNNYAYSKSGSSGKGGGGGIYCADGSTVTVNTNATFKGNNASGNSGNYYDEAAEDIYVEKVTSGGETLKIEAGSNGESKQITIVTEDVDNVAYPSGTGTDFKLTGGAIGSTNTTVVVQITNENNERKTPRKVTFHANEGSFSGNITAKEATVADGSRATEPNPAPTRTGYTLDGWYTEAACTNAWDFNTGVTGDLTLYAKWNAITVTFVPNNGNTSTTSTASTTNGTVTVEPPTARNGYVFEGWYSTSNFAAGTKIEGSESNINYTPTASVTLYAKWRGETYTVTFNVNGGNDDSKPANITVTHGTKYGAAFPTTQPTHGTNDQKFAGWYTAANSGKQITANSVVGENDESIADGGSGGKTITLYAKWDTNPSFEVKFIIENVIVATQLVVQGTKPADPVISRTGYTLNGWYDNDGCTGTKYAETANSETSVSAFAGVNETKNYYGKWTANTYNITLDVNGGANWSSKPSSPAATFDAAYPSDWGKPDPPAGHTFAGWFTEKTGGTQVIDADGQPVSGVTVTTAGDHTLYAHWTPVQYTITFYANGGSVTQNSKIITYADRMTYDVLPTPVRKGYTFNGWFTAASGGTEVTSSTIFTETSEKALYARWTAKSISVTLSIEGAKETISSPITVTFGELYPVLPVPKREYATFDGWYTAMTGGTKVESTTTVENENDHTLFGRWGFVKVTVTFDSKGGSPVASQSVDYGSAATRPANPTRNGYTFENWYSDPTFATRYTFDTPVTAPVTLYAKWTANPVTPPSPSTNPSSGNPVYEAPGTGAGGGGGTVVIRPSETPTPSVTPTTPAPPPQHRFSDVPESAWYAGAVDYVFRSGLMVGTGEDTFDPNMNTNRAMVTTILYRLEDTPEAGFVGFSDVEYGKYYTEAVAWAEENGVVTGYEDGNFYPERDITREQLAVLLFRYARLRGFDVSAWDDLSGMTDAAGVSGYALEAMQWAVGAGILEGDDLHQLLPADFATRAQIAAVFQRFCEAYMTIPTAETPVGEA